MLLGGRKFIGRILFPRTCRSYCISLKGRMALQEPTPMDRKEKVGLFGMEGLHKPEDFARFASDAQAKTEEYKQSIFQIDKEGLNVDNAKEIITLLDGISDNICSVADVAEVGKQVVLDENWKSMFTTVFGFYYKNY